MKGDLFAALLLLLAGCATPDPLPPPPKTAAPFAGCLAAPPPLPPIATVKQLKARHDALDRLYPDCATRARRNAEAVK